MQPTHYMHFYDFKTLFTYPILHKYSHLISKQSLIYFQIVGIRKGLYII